MFYLLETEGEGVTLLVDEISVEVEDIESVGVTVETREDIIVSVEELEAISVDVDEVILEVIDDPGPDEN